MVAQDRSGRLDDLVANTPVWASSILPVSTSAYTIGIPLVRTWMASYGSRPAVGCTWVDIGGRPRSSLGDPNDTSEFRRTIRTVLAMIGR
jgi:hypothetical protein